MSHSTRKLGQTFTWLGWIIGFFLLALFFDKVLDTQLNPNQSYETLQRSDYEEIKLTRNRYGHYILNGSINDKAVTFLIDTGATATSIPYQLIDYLGLKKGTAFNVQTANGISKAFSTTLDSLKLGDMQFNTVSASLNPGFKGPEILLGMNILKNLELIQRGEYLTIRKLKN